MLPGGGDQWRDLPEQAGLVLGPVGHPRAPPARADAHDGGAKLVGNGHMFCQVQRGAAIVGAGAQAVRMAPGPDALQVAAVQFRAQMLAQRLGIDAAPARFHFGEHVLATADDRFVERTRALDLFEEDGGDHVVTQEGRAAVGDFVLERDPGLGRVLNRRGRARLLACVACGDLARCERCGATVVQHEGELTCPRCEAVRPQVCLHCHGSTFRAVRPGITKVREDLAALLPRTKGAMRMNTTLVVVATDAALTKQYLGYVEEIRNHNLELAAEYLLMAAMLIEIKSRMLLPPKVTADGTEAEDPRAELTRRLLAYEQTKLQAAQINELPQLGRDFLRTEVFIEQSLTPRWPEVNAIDLRAAWADLVRRAKLVSHHRISREALSVREYMSHLLRQLTERMQSGRPFAPFESLFDPTKGVPVLVVTFVAMLELSREALIEVTQAEAFAPIYVRLAYSPIEEAASS